MRYPTKDRYFIEIYPGETCGIEANIIKLVEGQCCEDGGYMCEIILSSCRIFKNEEKSHTGRASIRIDNITFYPNSIKELPFNEEDTPIWTRRALTDEEMEKIAPFVI